MTVSPLVQVAALDDPRRLAALACTGLMDTPPEPTFDRLTRLAGRLLGAPAAFLTLVGADRPGNDEQRDQQWQEGFAHGAS